MPVLVRRRPSLDGLRKAAKAAEDGSKFDLETFSFEGSDGQHSDTEMDLPRHKLAKLPSRQKSRQQIRLATSSPVLHQRYQSDEEQASPTPDDADDDSDYLSCGTSSEDELSEEEFDFEDDFDTPLALPVVYVAAVEAIAVPIQEVGRPSIIDISAIAPMAKRSIPISRPESASFATLRKFKAPSPTTVRTSTFEPPVRPPPPRNFSRALQRSDSSCPSHSSTGTSPSSSIRSIEDSNAVELDEADLLIRESDEIQVRSRNILAGTEWDLSLDSQPMIFEDYSDFKLQPPALITTNSYTYSEPETLGKAKAWSRFGLKSRIMSAGKKVSKA